MQPENKDDGVPVSNRYRSYMFSKRYLGGIGRRTVFPIGESDKGTDASFGNVSSGKYSETVSTRTGSTARGQQFVIPVLTPDRLEKRQNGRRFKENGEPSFTLTGQDIHGVMQGTRIRRLTPTECERLQGFPDGWTVGVSDSQRYKCLGNAVTVNVIEAIIKKLIPS